MKLLSFSLFLLICNSIFSQNDFKVGVGIANVYMFENNEDYRCYDQKHETSPLLNINGVNYRTSPLNQLSLDGFNSVYYFEPDQYRMSEENFYTTLELVENHNMQILAFANKWFVPNSPCVGGSCGGVNIYNNFLPGMANKPTWNDPKETDKARPNYELLSTNCYKSDKSHVIWGHELNGEGCYSHKFNSGTGGYCSGGLVMNSSEVPPANVNDAVMYFRNNIFDHNQKICLLLANHGKTIHDYIDDSEWNPSIGNYQNTPIDYNPSEYVNLVNRPDVILVASYYQFPQTDWNNYHYSNLDDVPGNTVGIHYLGKFKSIDYFKGKGYEVHSVITNERSSGNTAKPEYLRHFHSYQNTLNCNWLWFQTYTSIIHGVKGVWMYHHESYDMSNTTEADNSDIFHHLGPGHLERYERQYFSDIYKSFISNLSRELRYLVDKNLISTDESSILYTKTDHFDENCIVPSADTYIPITYDNLPLWVEHINENYGLRYTIRTNGEEVIMIVSNPLNIPVTVPLNFEGLGNEIISNSYGVDVLFDTGTNSVSSSIYKVDRDSDIDLVNGLVGDSYYMPFNNGKNLTIDFGPMDVKILKFRSNTPIVNTDGWDKEWSNYGNGKIDGWSISDSDKFIKGDFDGDGEDELLCVQLNLSNNWASLLGYENGDWSWDWSNFGNNTIGDWTIRETDKFYVSDFDSDGKEELLIVQQDDDILNWASLYSYNNGVWIRDWSNLGNNTIGGWSIKELDRFVVGDYDDDDKGDLLCIQAENNFGNWSALLDFENGVWNWKWSNYGNNMIGTWGIRIKDSFFAGKYKIHIFGKLTDFSYKLVCIQGDGGWAKTLRFYNGNWVEQYNNYSSGLIGGWGVPLQSSDVVLSANFDNDLIDELIFIQTGSSNPGWAASQSLILNLSDWNWNWSVSPNTLSYINDWPIADLGIGKTKYMSLKPELNKPEMILAIRDFGCDGNERFLASLYSSQVYVNKSINKVNDSLNIQSNVMIVYPNPSSGEITIKLKNEELLNGEIVIYDAKGSKIYNQKVNKKRNVSLNLNEQNNGLYYVHYFNEFISTTVKFQIVK